MTPADEAPPPPAWTFDALVREGRALIPVHAPAWADQNLSDPGITLLELLAYVTEVLVLVSNEIGLGVIPMGREMSRMVNVEVKTGQGMVDAITRQGVLCHPLWLGPSAAQ